MSTSSSSSNVFEVGKYRVELQRVKEAEKSSSSVSALPPKPLLIGFPCEDGEFPVLLLLHGFLLSNSFYSQLIQHIASHGFIVIAPQLYEYNGPDASDDIKSTAAITNWLSEGLQSLLPPHVQANLNKLVLIGHSRGGKVSFALALGKEGITTSLKFSALIGIDPVDGMKGEQTHPPVLTYDPRSFNLDGMAVMVIGSGLGEVSRHPWIPWVPPCAPKGVNHEDFFKECQKPACHFVTKDYGHFDMLDDKLEGFKGITTEVFINLLTKNGKSRKPMRKFVGGVVVAFIKAYLGGDRSELMAIKEGGHEAVPIELQTVEFR